MKNNKAIYIKIIGILGEGALTRRELIDRYIGTLGLTREELYNRDTHGKANVNRSLAGAAICEMLDKGMIKKNADGLIEAEDQRPVIVRKERCESELLRILDGRSLTKKEIRCELITAFGTEKTLTERDDSKLLSYMGDTLSRMVKAGAVTYDGRYYTLAERIGSKIDDIQGMLKLKSSYLTRLHRKGGEFFETYFMTLLEKYITSFGKRVVTNSTTGGSADGGIDGIMQTVDCLGFRETIMVQTKNRTDTTPETVVRGFYGAVCARQGSRGIFVTSSDFHPVAKEFLDSIDNCVGIDGDKLFEMAMATHYGIKKVGGVLSVDDKLL